VPGQPITFVIEDAGQDVAVGDHLNVFGTLQSDNHITAENTIQRAPGATWYMYLVSFLAGLLVFGRLLNHWTVDTSNWTVVPRQHPLVEVP